jgi:hypothetical protein
MKIEVNGIKEFQPVTVTLTATNQDELDKLGALFNHYSLTEFLGVSKQRIWDALKGQGADLQRFFGKLEISAKE